MFECWVQVFSIISIAASGLAAQSRRIEAVARTVASTGSSAPERGSGSPSGAGVRVASLPVGDPVESMVTLVEAENAYRMNAAVLLVASDMLDTLLDAFEPRR